MARFKQDDVAARMHQFISTGESGEASANDDDLLGSASGSRPFSEPARAADQEPGGSRQSELQELTAVKRRGRFVPPGQVCEEGSRHMRDALVHRVMSRRRTVGFKRVWMRGVSEEHIRRDT